MRLSAVSALALFDEANRQDPCHEKDEAGTEYPRELLYSMRMTARLLALCPAAGEALQLAVRAQHLKRWTLQRNRWPMDREGYLRWRTALRDFHADEASRLMHQAGCPEDLIQRTASLIRKERLKLDQESQLLEDTACLVFLQHYFLPFALKHPPDKVSQIVRKTWFKMGELGRREAQCLDLPEAAKKILLTDLNTLS